MVRKSGSMTISNIVAYSMLVLLPFTVDEDLCALVVGACGSIDFIFCANSYIYIVFILTFF